MKSRRLVVAGIVGGWLLAAGVLLVPARTWAVDHSWGSGVTGDWSVSGNWSPATVPAAGDNVFLNKNGTAQISSVVTAGVSATDGSLKIDSWEGGAGLGGNLEVNTGGVLNMNGAGIHVGAGYRELTEGTLTVNGGTITNLGTQYIFIPRQGRGVMTINSGSVYYSGIWMSLSGLDDEINWPSASLCYGKFYMNGGQLVRTGSSQDFYVGTAGTGTVIMAGGLIDDNVNGAYEKTLWVGYFGVGEFLQSGGTSRWNKVLINRGTLGRGTLTVTNNARLEMGRGSTANNKNIIMYNGSALNVQAGGEIVGLGTGTRCIYAGEDSGNTGVVTMTGGRIDSVSGVYLGTDLEGSANGAGVGIFNMSGGFGVLGNLNVGYSTGGKGIATLSGGTVSNTALRIGGQYNIAATASSTGTVTISGTHILIPNGGVTVGDYNNCQGTLNMSGGTVSNASQGISFGYGSGSRAYGTLTGGVMNVGGLGMGAGANSRSEVSMGGTFALRTAGNVDIGYGGAGHYVLLSISNDAAVTIDGDSFNVGSSGGTGIVNMAGGTLTQTAASRGLDIGRGGPGWLNLSGGTLECQQVYYDRYNASSSHINVSGGTLYARNGIVVQGGGAGSTLVATGGVVDFGTGDLAVNSDNSVTNAGGVFQFRSANPTITPGTFGTIVFDSGTMSFRGISDADVFCNQNGKPWSYNADINYLGNNAFRLNCATNLSGSQAYTFQTGTTTNWVRLELMNGAMWRGGTATIGSGGTLVVGTGTNSMATNLTFAAGGTLAMTFGGPGQSSYLLASGASGAVNLNNATLSVTLTAAPQMDVLYPILGATGGGSITGSFQNNSVTASYGGKEYNMAVRYGANAVSIGLASRGTVIVIR